ncbi:MULTISPECIES: cardiolipin synthase [unclassified Cryobacterium]|uniref:cardiolipin synthase n=1 Tax=unclassified Cryobacterium TaxID=2649013 RepID=UPI002AB3E9A8|nr:MULTISPECIES: cardiolipin synthase [unclassified Cryobacterium]MDY7527773.1 cardiolipin synthase [Cryobacterium sp. 10C2]MEB0001725.1 cardiolipin synthase [Cryobacterium sp. RTC2.1]MEB0200198.1 cardiolipin synthase [Cryobacterium sp. 5I3]MEB0289081.1 cardiolipin synthase [Cryobacterium sp. 10C2]
MAIRVGAVIRIPPNRRPTAAMAWLMAIFIAPIPGAVLFSLFGSSRLPRARREKQQDINDYILGTTAGLDQVSKTETWPQWFESVVELNHTLGAMPLVGGNDAVLLPDYEESIAAMTEEVMRAERYVHVEFYILSRDRTTMPFFDALLAAHERGVIVRVLYDHISTIRSPQGRATRRWLRNVGIDSHEMLPFHPFRTQWRRPDLRNHRKVLVIDGIVGFMGSQNMVDPSYNTRGNIKRNLRWKDLMVRLEGPVVAGVNAIFITDWYSETEDLLTREADPIYSVTTEDTLDCQVVPSGPGFEGENNLRVFNALLYSAQERLVIASPYFVPDDSMLYAITTAAERGVTVHLYACEVADQALVYHAQRSYYETLLRAGVRIFLYEKPVVLHAKHFTVDDEVAVIGSSNMDMRSFSLNFEISLLVRGRRFVDALRRIQDDYRSHSREVLLDEWLQRPLGTQVLDNLSRLTATVQ